MNMSEASNQRSTVVENLDEPLKDAAEGYGDLMAISVVHKVSMSSLRSRLKELQIEQGRELQRERENDRISDPR
jgi:adenylate kinase